MPCAALGSGGEALWKSLARSPSSSRSSSSSSSALTGPFLTLCASLVKARQRSVPSAAPVPRGASGRQAQPCPQQLLRNRPKLAGASWNRLELAQTSPNQLEPAASGTGQPRPALRGALQALPGPARPPAPTRRTSPRRDPCLAAAAGAGACHTSSTHLTRGIPHGSAISAISTAPRRRAARTATAQPCPLTAQPPLPTRPRATAGPSSLRSGSQPLFFV